MNDAFQAPPAWRPIDLDARLAALPPGRTVRGFVINAAAGRLSLPATCVAYRDYPLEDFLRLLHEGARGEPARLERAGRAVGPSLRSSMLGRVLLALAADSVDGVLSLAQRLYRVGVSFGDIEVEHLGERHAVIQLRDVWGFHPYLYGTVTGLLGSIDPGARFAYRAVSMTGFDVRVRW